MNEIERGFLHSLGEKPDDWTTRAIYADFLEEAGRFEEAESQRWMVDNSTVLHDFFVNMEIEHCKETNQDIRTNLSKKVPDDFPTHVMKRLDDILSGKLREPNA